MPELRLPDDIEQIASMIPAWPRGLPELRWLLGQLPPLSPNALPGITPALFPEEAGQVATSGTGQTTGASSGGLTTGEGPGTIPGSAITPGTLPAMALANTIRAVGIVGSLPVLPSPAYPIGAIVYNRGDVPARLYRTNDGLTWEAAVDAVDIVANSITAGQMAVGAISSEELFTKLMVANVIRTAESGSRVEFSQQGIDLYDSDNQLRARLPTDVTQSVYVRGTIDADSLESAAAKLDGATSIVAGGTATVEAGITKPVAAPTLTRQYPSFAVFAPTSGAVNDGVSWGLAYDGAGSYWTASTVTTDGIVKLEKFAADGTLLTTLTPAIPAGNLVDGIAYHNGLLYVLMGQVNPTACVLYEIHPPTGVIVRTLDVTAQVVNANNAGLFADATLNRLVVVTRTDATATAQYRFRLINAVTLTVGGAVDATGLAVGQGGSPGGARVGDDWWVSNVGGAVPSLVRAFNATTGAYVANSDFGYYPESGAASAFLQGFTHNGAVFVARSSQGSGEGLVFTSNWTWGAESSLYWVGYSWIDGVGGYETELGKRASITMYRRMALKVQHAAKPSGATTVGIYAQRGAAQPAAGTYRWQANNGTATLWVQVPDFQSATDTDEVANTFPGASPATLRSGKTPGWSLEGDNRAAFGGRLAFTDAVTSVLTTSPANWNPAADDAVVIQIDCNGANRNIHSLVDGKKAAGTMKLLQNVTTGFDATLVHLSASAADTATRFACPGNADLVLRRRGSVWVRYSGSAWFVVAP